MMGQQYLDRRLDIVDQGALAAIHGPHPADPEKVDDTPFTNLVTCFEQSRLTFRSNPQPDGKVSWMALDENIWGSKLAKTLPYKPSSSSKIALIAAAS